jgi:crotonobetainyl-CoA:carnitine CoA-transferase CaiB-like acyl-CoA transferase
MLALEGITVLDLTSLIPGQFCTMLLADMGADVIKIERSANETEGASPIFHRIRATRRLERNKKSIVVDLKTADGHEVFCRLAKKADVVLEGYRPNVTRKLGIDYDTLKVLNPRIIYCSLSGFGQDGPYMSLPGFDLTYISTAGVLSIIRDSNGYPVIPSNLIGDIAGGGMLAAYSIVTALICRERKETGQYIDIGILDGVITVMAQAFALHWYGQEHAVSGYGLETENRVDYHVYKTKNGFISIAALAPQFWDGLCKALGREDLIMEQNNKAREREIQSIFENIFLTKTKDEWFNILTQHDVPVAKVLDLDEVTQCPQVIHRDMIVDVIDPATSKSEKHVGISIKLSETPGSIRTLPPSPGQDTDEILHNLGYEDTDIERLRKSNVVA